MKLLKQLFEQNREWAEQIKAEDPQFLKNWHHNKRRSICGSVARTVECPRTNCWVYYRVMYLCIATWQIWWCTPTLTVCQ
jgi:hypothetical protein